MSSLKAIIQPNSFKRAIASGMAKKSLATYQKVIMLPMSIDHDVQLQFAYHYPMGVIHKNYRWPDGVAAIERLMGGYFKQLIVETNAGDYHVLSNKKGHIKIVSWR